MCGIAGILGRIDDTNRAALRRRIARGAGVEIRDLEEEDVTAIEELLLQYHRELFNSNQDEEAEWVEGVIARCRSRFVKIAPGKTVVEPLNTE